MSALNIHTLHSEQANELRLLQEKLAVQTHLAEEKRACLATRCKELSGTEAGLEEVTGAEVRGLREEDATKGAIEELQARLRATERNVRDGDCARRDLVLQLEVAAEETKLMQRREWEIRETLAKQDLTLNSHRLACSDMRDALSHRLESLHAIQRDTERTKMEAHFLMQKHRDCVQDVERLRLEVAKVDDELAKVSFETESAQRACAVHRSQMMRHNQDELAAITAPIRDAQMKAKFSPAVPRPQQDHFRLVANVDGTLNSHEQLNQGQRRTLQGAQGVLLGADNIQNMKKPRAVAKAIPLFEVPPVGRSYKNMQSPAGKRGGGSGETPFAGVMSQVAAVMATADGVPVSEDSIPPPPENIVAPPPATPLAVELPVGRGGGGDMGPRGGTLDTAQLDTTQPTVFINSDEI